MEYSCSSSFLQHRDNHLITSQLSTEELIGVCEAFQQRSDEQRGSTEVNGSIGAI